MSSPYIFKLIKLSSSPICGASGHSGDDAAAALGLPHCGVGSSVALVARRLFVAFSSVLAYRTGARGGSQESPAVSPLVRAKAVEGSARAWVRALPVVGLLLAVLAAAFARLLREGVEPNPGMAPGISFGAIAMLLAAAGNMFGMLDHATVPPYPEPAPAVAPQYVWVSFPGPVAQTPGERGLQLLEVLKAAFARLTAIGGVEPNPGWVFWALAQAVLGLSGAGGAVAATGLPGLIAWPIIGAATIVRSVLIVYLASLLAWCLHLSTSDWTGHMLESAGPPLLLPAPDGSVSVMHAGVLVPTMNSTCGNVNGSIITPLCGLAHNLTAAAHVTAGVNATGFAELPFIVVRTAFDNPVLNGAAAVQEQLLNSTVARACASVFAEPAEMLGKLAGGTLVTIAKVPTPRFWGYSFVFIHIGLLLFLGTLIALFPWLARFGRFLILVADTLADQSFWFNVTLLVLFLSLLYALAHAGNVYMRERWSKDEKAHPHVAALPAIWIADYGKFVGGCLRRLVPATFWLISSLCSFMPNVVLGIIGVGVVEGASPRFGLVPAAKSIFSAGRELYSVVFAPVNIETAGRIGKSIKQVVGGALARRDEGLRVMLTEGISTLERRRDAVVEVFKQQGSTGLLEALGDYGCFTMLDSIRKAAMAEGESTAQVDVLIGRPQGGGGKSGEAAGPNLQAWQLDLSKPFDKSAPAPQTVRARRLNKSSAASEWGELSCAAIGAAIVKHGSTKYVMPKLEEPSLLEAVRAKEAAILEEAESDRGAAARAQLASTLGTWKGSAAPGAPQGAAAAAASEGVGRGALPQSQEDGMCAVMSVLLALRHLLLSLTELERAPQGYGEGAASLVRDLLLADEGVFLSQAVDAFATMMGYLDENGRRAAGLGAIGIVEVFEKLNPCVVGFYRGLPVSLGRVLDLVQAKGHQYVLGSAVAGIHFRREGGADDDDARNHFTALTRESTRAPWSQHDVGGAKLLKALPPQEECALLVVTRGWSEFRAEVDAERKKAAPAVGGGGGGGGGAAAAAAANDKKEVVTTGLSAAGGGARQQEKKVEAAGAGAGGQVAATPRGDACAAGTLCCVCDLAFKEHLDIRATRESHCCICHGVAFRSCGARRNEGGTFVCEHCQKDGVHGRRPGESHAAARAARAAAAAAMVPAAAAAATAAVVPTAAPAAVVSPPAQKEEEQKQLPKLSVKQQRAQEMAARQAATAQTEAAQRAAQRWKEAVEAMVEREKRERREMVLEFARGVKTMQETLSGAISRAQLMRAVEAAPFVPRAGGGQQAVVVPLQIPLPMSGETPYALPAMPKPRSGVLQQQQQQSKPDANFVSAPPSYAAMAAAAARQQQHEDHEYGDSDFRGRQGRPLLAAVPTGHLLAGANVVVHAAEELEHGASLVDAALTQEVRRQHRALLIGLIQWLRRHPACLGWSLERCAATYMHERAHELRRGAVWQWATLHRNMCALAGALSSLALYTNVPHGVCFNKHNAPHWTAALATVALRAKQTKPTALSAVAAEDVETAIAASPYTWVRAALLLMWLSSQRVGCVLQIQVQDVVLDAETGSLMLYMRQGKGVRANGPYAVPTCVEQGPWRETIAAQLRQRQREGARPTDLLFPATADATLAQRRTRLLAAIRVANPALNLRAMRRGSLQTASESSDVTLDMLRIRAGHARETTTVGYLDNGLRSGERRRAGDVIARALQLRPVEAPARH